MEAGGAGAGEAGLEHMLRVFVILGLLSRCEGGTGIFILRSKPYLTLEL